LKNRPKKVIKSHGIQIIYDTYRRSNRQNGGRYLGSLSTAAISRARQEQSARVQTGPVAAAYSDPRYTQEEKKLFYFIFALERKGLKMLSVPVCDRWYMYRL